MSDDTPHAPQAQTPPGAQSPSGAAEEPWAARFGLVRPRHGRYVAGVCAAIGRATNTDPLLWRVLIGVLAIFGVGIVIYLAGWLVTPAEDDTASPIEALFGRGRSSTSALLTLILTVITVVLLGVLTNSAVVAVIAAVALVVAALAVNPRIKPQQRVPAKPEEPITPAPPEPAAPVHPSYQPPFAPHGPYAGGAEPVPPKITAKPAPEPSRLGRFIFGMVLVSLGILGLADMSGASVPAGVYFATALAVIGAGLIVGAWFGRARGFILLGLLLSLVLPTVPLGQDVARGSAGREHWSPASVEELDRRYSHRFGEATLDLTDVDFAGRDAEVTVDISFGSLMIRLPSNVDATVVSNVSAGDAEIFDKSTSGVGTEHVEKDQGGGQNDGSDGRLVINLNVRFGHAEVTR